MAENFADDFLNKLVNTWRSKIELAKQHKKPWDDVREQCMTFVTGAVGEVWSNTFQQRFLGTQMPVKFKISLNKAFELIALFGPVLYARNPTRSVHPNRPVELEPEVFGDPNDPMVQQIFQQAETQQESEFARNRVRCRLLETYLNYTPTEQPGGLEQAAEDAITDALISGLGFLFPAPFTMPGSNRVLTGCFYESPRNVLYDPDARKPDFGHAKWVARRHLDPIWEIERRFKLKKGALKGHAYIESNSAIASRQASDLGNLDRSRGYTFDQIEWYEIWSIGGVGSRLAGADESLRTAFDRHVGDYAYLAVTAGGVPWPLNSPPAEFRAATVEDIQQRFRWPVPFWQDRRWPFAALEFYRHPDNAYPIAPLAPGLGELTLLNFLITRLATHVWQSTKQFVAVAESALKQIEAVLREGKDLAVFGIPDMQKNINNLVSFLQYPNLSTDIYSVIANTMEMFDKRTGLTELWYSMNPGGAASRTARDVQAKQEKASIRPDHMAKKVEQWLTQVSAMEKLCAFWGDGRRPGVRGQDIQPLLGSVGAGLWDQLFANADPEVIAREMYCTVVAGTAKKRNHQTELAAVNQIYAPLSQQLGEYAQLTGDSEPLNALNNKLFEVLQYDGNDLKMGPWAPPQAEQQGPDPEQVREDEKHQQDLTHEQEKHDQKMDIEDEEADQSLDIEADAAAQDLRLEEAKGKLQARLARTQQAAA